jgi:hypothetical protein
MVTMPCKNFVASKGAQKKVVEDVFIGSTNWIHLDGFESQVKMIGTSSECLTNEFRIKYFELCEHLTMKKSRSHPMATQLVAKFKDTPGPPRTTEEAAAFCTSPHVHDVLLGHGRLMGKHGHQ